MSYSVTTAGAQFYCLFSAKVSKEKNRKKSPGYEVMARTSSISCSQELTTETRGRARERGVLYFITGLEGSIKERTIECYILSSPQLLKPTPNTARSIARASELLPTLFSLSIEVVLIFI